MRHSIVGRSVLGGLFTASLLAVIAACSQGPGTTAKMEEMEEQPPPTPKPTLVGTFQRDHTWQEEDGTEITTTTLLTFTETRFIEVNVERLSSGVVHDRWSTPGTWTHTESMVTKIYHPWDDDEGRRSEQAVSIVKEYVWGDEERNVLFVHPWDWDDPAHEFHRFQRVENPLPPESIAGVWKDRSEDEERGITWDWSLTVTSDSFTYRNEIREGDELRVFSFMGRSRLDPVNNFLFVNVESIQSIVNGERHERYDLQAAVHIGHELRLAYAPTGIPNTLAISQHFRELQYDDEEMTWIDRPLFPYGEYWFFERQPATAAIE